MYENSAALNAQWYNQIKKDTNQATPEMQILTHCGQMK